MRTNNDFTLLEVIGKMVLAGPEGCNAGKPCIFTLNPTAAFLWREIQGREFECQDLADLLIDEYGISRDIAIPDAQEILDVWVDNGVVKR